MHKSTDLKCNRSGSLNNTQKIKQARTTIGRQNPEELSEPTNEKPPDEVETSAKMEEEAAACLNRAAELIEEE